MNFRSFKSRCYYTAATTVLATLGCNGGALAEARSFNIPSAEARSFNIPSEDAVQAIPEFARQAGIQIFVPAEKLRGVRLGAVKGTLEVHEALGILLAGSGLSIATDDGKYITLSHQPVPVLNKTSAAVPQTQLAQNQPAPQAAVSAAPPAAVEEVVVTGTRIVREGYEAPTPLTVVGTEALERSADSSLVNILNTMPAVSGSATGRSSSSNNGNGGLGVEALNLRALGSNRVLVLLDGQRVAPATFLNYVDTGSFPQQLISRVDVVTGGASAVYGSDAVSGVVNFVLDRKYTGVKGELSGGLTNYGDGKNYKLDLSAGFGFADERGHVLLSAEHLFNAGIHGDGGRAWDQTGWLQITNPTYTATNGQAQLLMLPNSSLGTGAPGALVVAGPLKGTAFGAGGAPYQFKFGSVFRDPLMSGGDWQMNIAIKQRADMEPSNNNDNLFTRVSYDVTDNINVFAQYAYAQIQTRYNIFANYTPGTATAYMIKNDNAFLPASVKAAMAANGVTQMPIGSWNSDFPSVGTGVVRKVNRINAGLEGNFDAFESNWKWNAYYAYGSTKITQHEATILKSRYPLAIDAVVSPATGQVVCRSTLTNPNNGCKPWNVLGVGVNSGNQAAIDWLIGGNGGGLQNDLIEQTTMAASVNGEPFSLWAGPVSLAVSLEHRKDAVEGVNDPFSVAADRIVGNFPALHGSQSVTEGAVETIIPLAKNESWAQNWDLSMAARFTGYTNAGYVTTYKFGSTYTPVDDIKFRVTRSRDIRAPTISDLFATSQTIGLGATTLDRFLNNAPVPSTSYAAQGGNPNLAPEKADTTGVGVVLAPRFLEGFTASVDYWDVSINGAIQALSPQVIIDNCYNNTLPVLCTSIIRNAAGTIDHINNYSINLAVQDVRGIDLEASYRLPISNLVPDWRGNFSLHGNVTFYLRNYAATGFSTPTDTAGQNTGSGPPNWKMTATASYELEPVTVSLTGRAFSNGTFDNRYIVCSTGCPAATADHPTTNLNTAPGRFYLDANVNYKLAIGETTAAELFLSVKNLFNNDVPPLPEQYYYSVGHTSTLYDQDGAVYRAGIRFKM